MKHSSINLCNDLDEFSLFLQGCGLSDNTIRAYLSDINNFLLYSEDKNMFETSISYLEFEVLCEEYIKEIKELEKGKDSTKVRKCSALRKLTKYLSIKKNKNNKFGDEIIPNIYYKKNFYHSILSKADILSLLKYYDLQIETSKSYKKKFKSYRNKLMFLFILETGVRAYELINIKWSHISFSKNTIYICDAVNNQNRYIPLKNKLKKDLLNYKKKYDSMFTPENIECGYVFCSAYFDKKLTTKTIRYITEDITSKNIIDKHLSPLMIRHTMVYNSLKSGMSLNTLSQILGHKHFCSTNELYQNLIKEI